MIFKQFRIARPGRNWNFVKRGFVLLQKGPNLFLSWLLLLMSEMKNYDSDNSQEYDDNIKIKYSEEGLPVVIWWQL